MARSTKLFFILVLIGLVVHCHSAPKSRRSKAASLPPEDNGSGRQTKLQEKFKQEITTKAPTPTNRRNKALNFLGFLPSFLSSSLDYNEDDDDDVTFSVNDDHFPEEDLSRTIPNKRRQQNKKKNGNAGFSNDNINSLQYDNSPIFYIRLPPTPYMFVPGLGYVSQPPSLTPPMAPMMPPVVPPQPADPFINLPLDFVSNGKPTGVYQWNGAPDYQQVPQVPQLPDPYGYGAPQPIIPPQQPTYEEPAYTKPKPKPKPKPSQSNSKITNLKGQYNFNGKPGDSVYVLRDTYNSIYSDALQNFYP